jgi:hypothetical protein
MRQSHGAVLRVWGGRLAVVAVLGVGITVAVDALMHREDGQHERAAPRPTHALGGPNVPSPTALHGTLYLAVGDTCRLQAINLAAVAAGMKGRATTCGLWVAPKGNLVAFSRDRRGQSYELWLARLGNPPAPIRRLGLAEGRPSWSDDGSRLAWCGPDESTVILDIARGTQRSIEGCRPAFTRLGVLTRRAGEILRNGTVLIGRYDLGQPFRGMNAAVDVLGYDAARNGLVAVAVASSGRLFSRAALELWREQTLKGIIELPVSVTLGDGGGVSELVRFSPTGQEVVVGLPGGLFGLLVVDIRTRRITLMANNARAFVWSPDGAWLARSTGNAIVFSGSERSEPTYALPLEAWGIAWR